MLLVRYNGRRDFLVDYSAFLDPRRFHHVLRIAFQFHGLGDVVCVFGRDADCGEAVLYGCDGDCCGGLVY